MYQEAGVDAMAPALKVHVALNVRDVEASIYFYRRLFGIEPSKVRSGYAKFDVQSPPVNLSLNQGAPTTTGALSHLGIQVPSTEDVLSIKQRWQEAGLQPRDEMQTTCCFALQDKAWVRDPDGNEWEVFVVLQDNLSGNGTNSCCSGTEALVTIGQ
jgi:catechol 2,3-dioxygenase-like lactoylglutathione lyase family enzyme